jgi:CheY-like chemotaxis protein
MTVPLTATEQSRFEGQRAEPRHILVVDDEPLIGTTLRILLEDYVVSVVTSGRAAREVLARGERFDVVLCDLMLDGFSGIDLARWLERERPELSDRLVFMTGGAFTDEARLFLRTIPNARQLEKPFSADEVMRAIERAGRSIERVA